MKKNLSRVSRKRKEKRIKIIENLKVKTKEYLKSLPKRIMANTMYIIVGVLYTLYLVVRYINNMVATMFMRLPRIARVCVVYVLLIGFMFNFIDIKESYAIPDTNVETPVESESVESKQESNNENVEIVVDTESRAEKIIKEEYQCNLDETSCKIYHKAIEMGLNEEQSLICVAIARWETGRFTSVIFKNKNNVGGMYKNGGFVKYDSIDDGVYDFVNNLANNYFGKGLTTLEQIQSKYAPINANNDPNGLNNNWLNGVRQMLKEIQGK